MKKVLMSVGAVIIIAIAALNVNVSLMTEKVPYVSLSNVQALANAECEQVGVSLLVLSNYKMAITNTDKRGGVAIKSNPPLTVSSAAAYGLDVEQNVVTGRTSSTAIRAYAVSSSSTITGNTCGVHATAGNGSAGYNYGVFANLSGCQNGAALYATSDDNLSQLVSGRYAGYFQGNVCMTGGKVGIGGAPNSTHTLNVTGSLGINGVTVTTSDSRCKTNVKTMRSSLDKIAKLRPVTYNFKPDDLSEFYALVPDSVKINNEEDLRWYFGLGEERDVKRKHIGFIAQEIQAVFPELVYEDEEGMLGVDYVSLIPVLAGAVQEQQKIIDEQNATIQMLINRLEALEKNANIVQENNFSFSLYPNPVSNGFVTVEYTMHVDAPISIELYNTFGQKLKVLTPRQNQQAGSYSVLTSVSELNLGTYIVRATSGNQSESKQLVINK